MPYDDYYHMTTSEVVIAKTMQNIIYYSNKKKNSEGHSAYSEFVWIHFNSWQLATRWMIDS